MTGSRINPVLAVLLLLAPCAYAQADSDAHEAISAITLPDPPETRPAPHAAPAPTPVRTGLPVLPATVEAGALGTPEGDAVGLLEGAQGLGADLWAASRRGDIETLLARAPLAATDPVLRELSRRLILTKAAAPPGASKIGTSWTGMRMSQLLNAGLIDEAGALAALARLPGDKDFASVQAKALLYAGRGAEACGDATLEARKGGERFWIELRATCAVLAGDTAMAELTKEVLAAQGGDPAFEVLLDDLMHGGKIAPKPTAPLSPLHVFLMRKLDLALGGEAAKRGDTAVNLFVMRDKRHLPAVRLAAAERIAATGAADPLELRALLDAQAWKPERLAAAQGEAQDQPFLLGQALLRRAAQMERGEERRANLLYSGLRLAESKGLLILAARLNADLLAGLTPAPYEAAPLFATALLLAGDRAAAGRWKPQDDKIKAALWIGSIDPADGEKTLAMAKRFAGDLSTLPPSQAPYSPEQYRQLLILGLFDAMGKLPPDLHRKLGAPPIDKSIGERPAPSVMARIDALAFAPGGRGETLLLILDSVRAIGWRDLAPDVAVKFVRLLRSYGMNDIAAAMAVQSLLIYLPPPQQQFVQPPEKP